MTRRVLVTGAGGFVCRSIISVLLERDYHVIALDRAFDPGLRERWAGRATLIEADVDALPDLDFDVFVHGAALTASPKESGMSAIANLRANLDPAFTLIERAGRARRGILISSSAVYRQTRGAVAEDISPAPMGMYAIAKHTIETLTESLRTLHGYDLTVIRLSSIYGPGERARATRPRLSTVGQMLDEALSTGVITVRNPDEKHDWTFAPDIGAAVDALLSAPQWSYPLYHAASEQTLTNMEVAEVIRQHVPAAKIVIGQPQTPPHPRQGYLVNERLREDIGFNQWTSFADGIRQVAAVTEP